MLQVHPIDKKALDIFLKRYPELYTTQFVVYKNDKDNIVFNILFQKEKYFIILEDEKISYLNEIKKIINENFKYIKIFQEASQKSLQNVSLCCFFNIQEECFFVIDLFINDSPVSHEELYTIFYKNEIMQILFQKINIVNGINSILQSSEDFDYIVYPWKKNYYDIINRYFKIQKSLLYDPNYKNINYSVDNKKLQNLFKQNLTYNNLLSVFKKHGTIKSIFDKNQIDKYATLWLEEAKNEFINKQPEILSLSEKERDHIFNIDKHVKEKLIEFLK